MSSRHFRKVCGSSSYLAPTAPQDDSDSDYEPLYVKKASQSTYAGLVLSSSSGSEAEVPSQDSTEDETPQPTTSRKKKRNNKKRGKNRATNDNALDEIDISLMEVNALLGTPPPAPSPTLDQAHVDPFRAVMAVQPKHLNVANELRRLFGPDDKEDRRLRNQPQRERMLKKILVPPMRDTTVYEFKRNGLSMSMIRRDNDVMYFAFDHGPELQRMHKTYLQRYKVWSSTPLLSLDETRRQMHVESLLEIVEVLFRLEEYSLANEIVENVVAYMQYCAHPSFNLANSNVRLEYKYWENRPFHVAVLKYVYLLSNKACHRTALELAKMLMTLDPSDPLAVIFIIDTLALRAREHQWLIEAVEYFAKERDAGLLFNLQYSNALAHFHVAVKNNGDLAKANKLLQDAVLAYPAVVARILECASAATTRLQSHDLYKTDDKSTAGFNELIMIYAKLSWPRWREPAVMEWFLQNVCEVAENYTNNEEIQMRAQELKSRRCTLFRTLPQEVLRHLGVFHNMSILLIEKHLTTFTRTTAGWDPLFCPGINRYNYDPYPSPTEPSSGGSALYSFEVTERYAIVEEVREPEPSVSMAFVIPPDQAAALARGDYDGIDYLRNYVSELQCLLIINGEYDMENARVPVDSESEGEEDLGNEEEEHDDGFDENSDCYEELEEEEEVQGAMQNNDDVIDPEGKEG